MRSELFGAFLLFFNVFFWIFQYFIQLCFTCRPSHPLVSTTALAVRRWNHWSNPQIILFLYLFICTVCTRRTCSARKWRCGSNSERKLWTRFEFTDFFLVRAASLFTLRTFGAQINWRVISRKVLFDPQRFLSNKSPIQLLERAEKEICFSMANGTFKMKTDIDRHGPRPMPNSCKNLNTPNFSLPSTFKRKSIYCINTAPRWGGVRRPLSL